MSIYKNGKLIAGGRQCMPLLSFMWADHQLNHPSWLNSTTFSWQSGAVYQAAYQHLVDDIDGQTAQTETVAGITISFYLANDGHKITTDESAVAQIYATTGVAWYYIVDTTNQRFKLPRTKFGFTGIRSGVGGYVEPAIPNIKGGLYKRDAPRINPNIGNAYREVEGAVDGYFGNSGAWAYNTIELNASLCSDVYKDDATTVQPPATEMYLYFYVGNFTQTALENTAGLNAELFNDKADVDLSNVSTTTRSGFLFSVSQESMSANNYYTLTFPNEIDPAKVKVNAYAVIKTANNNFAVGDVIPFESLWGQNYRPLSIRIKSTNLQFNTSDQISTNNPNNSGSGVNIVSYIRIVFDVYQVK